MKKRIAVIVIGAVAAMWPAVRARSAPAPVVAPAPIEADIALFARRAQDDPKSAADRAQLAGLYLQHGRETGQYSDFQQAERYARAALALRTDRNTKAKLVLASSLLAQHRFSAAREAANALVQEDPQAIGSRALLAEILLELGDYAAADAEFNALRAYDDNLALAPRLARWHEIHGRNTQARTILVRALEQTRTRIDLPPEQIAWFHLRVADHALRNGDLREADRMIREGLRAMPADYRLHSARARYFALKHEWRRVLEEVEKAGDRADLATVALAGDAALQRGDARLAEQYYARVEHNARARPEPFARQWTQFCLEHNRHQPETLRTLEAESHERTDVLGYELLAWAYRLKGDTAQARQAVDAALRLGTRDGLLWYTAAEVRLASGDRPTARDLFRGALDINPQFHPLLADSARRRLRELGG